MSSFLYKITKFRMKTERIPHALALGSAHLALAFTDCWQNVGNFMALDLAIGCFRAIVECVAGKCWGLHSTSEGNRVLESILRPSIALIRNLGQPPESMAFSHPEILEVMRFQLYGFSEFIIHRRF